MSEVVVSNQACPAKPTLKVGIGDGRLEISELIPDLSHSKKGLKALT